MKKWIESLSLKTDMETPKLEWIETPKLEWRPIDGLKNLQHMMTIIGYIPEFHEAREFYWNMWNQRWVMCGHNPDEEVSLRPDGSGICQPTHYLGWEPPDVQVAQKVEPVSDGVVPSSNLGPGHQNY